VLDKIFDYLETYEKEGNSFKGVKVFNSQLRAPTLIKRISAFIPNNIEEKLKKMSVPGQPENMRSAYRNLALLAIKEYIKDFPFLLHSPSSLRACFGMPTRKDRKSGRYSGVYLINDALSENSSTANQKIIDELGHALRSISGKRDSNQGPATRIENYLMENLHRDAMIEVKAPEVNTHTEGSLKFAKDYLLDLNFKNVVHEDEPKYKEIFKDAELTPDLYAEIWNQPVWAEMKEWEKFNTFFKPLKQIFTYMSNNPYTIILVEKPVEFYEFLESFVNPVITFFKFNEVIRQYMDRANNNSKAAMEFKRHLMRLGKKLIVDESISFKAEALYLGLVSEINNMDIGITNTELEACKNLSKIIDNLSRKHREIRIILLNSKLEMKTRSQPKQKLLLFLGVLNKNNSFLESSPILR